MRTFLRLAVLLGLTGWLLAGAQARADDENGAMVLVAHPALRSLDYRQTVLLVSPTPNGGHVGVIVNRPTRTPLASLFPDHGPSKKVVDPVYVGGPFQPDTIVAVVRRDSSPGQGSLQMMKNLYIAFRVTTIDQIIESTPNEARYFMGYVGWRPGELRSEIDRGVWSVLAPDPELIFRKDTENLWEELLMQTRRIRADAAPAPRAAQAAALAGAFSKVILPAR